jgi:transposase
MEAGDQKHKPPGDTPKNKAREHGRNSAAAYRGARKVAVPHASLKAGDPCPDCQHGKVYPQREPGVLVRIQGQAPIAATVYELEKLRCNLCGDVFTAAPPEGVGNKKYDETAASMIALLRYGSGFPWNRLEGLQENLGIPLPAATQCEIVQETAAPIQPAMDELIRQAAQGKVVHNDDTSMRVLFLHRDAACDADLAAERTGVFTSGIVSIGEGHRIGVYFTGRKHAGENLADVLKQRAEGLEAPIQMCDALSRNLPKLPKKLEIMVGHCLAHYLESGFIRSRLPKPCAGTLQRHPHRCRTPDNTRWQLFVEPGHLGRRMWSRRRCGFSARYLGNPCKRHSRRCVNLRKPEIVHADRRKVEFHEATRRARELIWSALSTSSNIHGVL